ncbi:MAG: hypothetical protein FJ399_18150 [Verrucomicrobia bacterium]|nr:hypothetical protein [Verrucomicrobiota bacterium]
MKFDRLVGPVVVVAAVLAVGVAARFPSAGGAVPGPAAFPIGMAVLWGLSGVALVLSGARRPAASAPAARAGVRPWALLALGVGYAAAMPWLGFVSGSALFVILALRALGYRHGWRAAAIGLSAAFVVYGVFGVVMNVPLPEGFFG